MRVFLNLFWQMLVFTGQIACWIALPATALIFAGWYTQGLDVETTHGAIATVAVYIVAGVAGIRGAARASENIKSYSTLKW